MLIKSGLTYQQVEPYAFNNELKLIKQVVNGLIQFGDIQGNNKNLYGTMAQITFPLANTDLDISHGLIDAPLGYLVLRTSNGGVVYDGFQPWSKTKIYLRSTTANNEVTIFILG